MIELPVLSLETGVTRNRDLRKRNAAAVLAAIDSGGSISQTDIIAETGLLGAAVSTIVSQLLSWGIVVEGAAVSTGHRGRPRRLLSLSRTFAAAVGVEISSESVDVRVADPRGEVIASSHLAHVSTDISPREFSRTVFDAVATTAPSVVSGGRPLSVAIAVPGLAADGVTTSRSRGWFTEPVSDLFAAAPSYAAVGCVVNDGDAAAMAEYTNGTASQYRHIAILHGSDGLAGGIINDGRPLLGYEGAASSLGHIPIEPVGGRDCPCGATGCLARYVSLSAFAFELDETELAASMSLPRYADDLARRAATDDVRVLSMLHRARGHLLLASHIIGAVVSPEVIVLTGNLTPFAPWLTVPHTRTRLQEGSRINWASPIIGSEFGGESVVAGVAEIARHAILLEPDLLVGGR